MWVEMYDQRYVPSLLNNALLAITITSEMKGCVLVNKRTIKKA